MKSQITFIRLTFYGPWATPCQESTPTPSILLVFSLLEVLRFGLRFILLNLVNFHVWIRIRISNTDPDPGQPINRDPDPQVVDYNTALLIVITLLAHTEIIFAIHDGSNLNYFVFPHLNFLHNSKLFSSILDFSIRTVHQEMAAYRNAKEWPVRAIHSYLTKKIYEKKQKKLVLL